jgi:hypothetical protein
MNKLKEQANVRQKVMKRGEEALAPTCESTDNLCQKSLSEKVIG